MTRTRAIFAATIAAAALLVAGCGSDTPTTPSPEPTTTSASPDASPSDSPDPVVVKPERPAEMDDDGVAGAQAAAVYFLELDDYIMKTGDTAEWEAMSHKSCEYCANRLEQAKKIATKGYVWDSDPTSTRITHTYEQDAATGIWPIDVEVAQGAVLLTDAESTTIYDEDAVKLNLTVEVARKDGDWVIIGVGQTESQ